jgi:hypothetical protein
MLMLHTGAEAIDASALLDVPMPPATKSHHPIAHHDVVQMVKFSLGFHGHEITEEHHGIMPDGLRYFGLLTLKSAHGDYTHTVGLRNSNDKSWPIGIAFGSRVFVCDNTAFTGEKVIKRRHTPNAKRDLPALVAEAIEPLHEAKLAMSQQYNRFKAAELGDYEADAAIMQMYRDNVINVQRIANVAEAWDNPPFDWGGKSAWRLFNAATFAMTGRVAEDPRSTQKLHEVVDGVCTRLN